MTTITSTNIAAHTDDDVIVRGRSLCRDLIGQVTFTQMTYLHVIGRMPTAEQTAVLDACLVTLMEHGMTPSVVASRVVYTSAPEAMQAAVAAGLLAVGSLFVGTVEGCALLLDRITGAPEGVEAEARRVAEEHRAERRPVPGFGHPQYRPDDPRSPCVLAVATRTGIAGAHVAALGALGRAIDDVAGRHITVNATGAVAAALGDAGIPAAIMRGFALLSRCAGLVGHVHEEQTRPAMHAIWDAADRAVPYDGASTPDARR